MAHYVHDIGNNEDAERRFRATLDLGESMLGPENLQNLETLDILGAVMRSHGH